MSVIIFLVLVLISFLVTMLFVIFLVLLSIQIRTTILHLADLNSLAHCLSAAPKSYTIVFALIVALEWSHISWPSGTPLIFSMYIVLSNTKTLLTAITR